MYANNVSMLGYMIEDILIKFVTPRLCKESIGYDIYPKILLIRIDLTSTYTQKKANITE